jgi:uncharacterized protein
LSSEPKETSFNPIPQIAGELSLPVRGVEAVVKLLKEGATVPFIARYRKELTGGLDETQIRDIEERNGYLLELEDRRGTILKSIDEQGKLSDELRKKIERCTSKTELEDLYLPYKPKRRTRATMARERGLEPLANLILEQPESGSPQSQAQQYIDAEKGVGDIDAALSGARDIVAETMAETADIRAMARRFVSESGELCSAPTKDFKEQRSKFEQYYEFSEKLSTIPSHRYLAIRRGEKEKVLKVKVDADETRIVPRIENRMQVKDSSPYAEQLRLAVQDGHRRLLAPAIETDLRVELKLRADQEAVEVFAENLRNLLLAAPLGSKAVIGIDPGLRTGCKCAALDSTGRFLENITIYISQGENKAEQARKALTAFIKRHQPLAIAVGNGTGGRETESFVRTLIKEDDAFKAIVVVQVNESGASVYSASDIAREEFPELDLTVRGAISIARRLQDPLAELVKIDPKAIGVGQYQHDVHQPLLAKKLDEVVESCVNRVGVELNTASAPLLARVAGVGPKLANSIVAHREKEGAFDSRKKLLKVAGLGPKTFEQAAGFLRVRGAKNPLDESAVHPERYKLVEQIAKDMQVSLAELVGNKELVERIDISRYVSDEVGEPTLRDILDELRKPGRDPRKSFEPPRFKEGVETLEDLQTGMRLEGVVTNVTNFGAFVDVGVHQDGLVHISQLADRFVRDPHEVVKVGDKLEVRVLDVDLERRRISLSARSEERRGEGGGEPRAGRSGENRGGEQNRNQGGRGPGRGGGANRGGGPHRGGGNRGDRPQQSRFTNNPFARLLDKK